ncbi:MAG TPA: hypothetical protein VGP08_02300 [Pyrinomonadaceae bacterium]|jgi:hypothetical protein|nr:hypothetical protein [Pyrinomonadaceae bacterium]
MTEFTTKVISEDGGIAPVSTLAEAPLPLLEARIDVLLPRLAQLNDDDLLQLAIQAGRLEACAFRLRGACVAELRRRTARLAGGKGKRDTARIGVKARLSDLAARLGVSVSTLKTDARIHEVFFSEDTGLAREPALPRDYYVTALRAPEPVAAIGAARSRSSDPAYTRDQFRRDVQALRSASTTADEPLLPGMPVPPPAITRVSILPDARPALTALVEREARTPAEVVAAALVAYHEALTATKTPARPSATKPAPQLVQQPLPLSQ